MIKTQIGDCRLFSVCASSLRQPKCEPDNDGGDDDHLHQQDGQLAPHIRHQDDIWLNLFQMDPFENENIV